MLINFNPIWADSLGAKTFCSLIKTPDISVLIDPGAAVLQRSFPASITQKDKWLRDARKRIKKASTKVDVVIISHYHYDHFTDFDASLYRGKLLMVKNPNEFINYSQRGRAENFFQNLCRNFSERKLNDFLKKAKRRKYEDPINDLPIARGKNFGDYQKRRKELLEKGRKAFQKKVNSWNKWGRIPELDLGKTWVRFPEGKELKFGETKLKFTGPLFHGIEYSQLGWVFATMIEYKGEKLMYSSDLCGVYVEDYAELIIKENPDILILDGPPTYLLPYMMNLINLERCVRNICNIVRKVDSELIILDHHLPRDRHYRERLKKVYELAERKNRKILTVAEYLGKRPVLL